MIQIMAEFGNALEVKDFLSVNRVDLLFLDIHMPVLSGISFLNTLKDPPQVVFTTAYQEYAVNAFDLAACDYLLKPFSLERFIVAVDRVKEKLANQPIVNNTDVTDALFVKSDGKIYRIPHADCLYLEAQGNYTKVVTANTSLLTKVSFTSFIEQLPSGTFIRVHRSFMINKKHIGHIAGNRVFVRQNEIPIAGHYKETFLKTIGADKGSAT